MDKSHRSFSLHTVTPPHKSPIKAKQRICIKVPHQHHQQRLDHFLQKVFPKINIKAFTKMVKGKELKIISLSSQHPTTYLPTENAHMTNNPLQPLLFQLDQKADVTRLSNLLQFPSSNPNNHSHFIKPHATPQFPLHSISATTFFCTTMCAQPSANDSYMFEHNVQLNTRVTIDDVILLPSWLSHFHIDKNFSHLLKQLELASSQALNDANTTRLEQNLIRYDDTHDEVVGDSTDFESFLQQNKHFREIFDILEHTPVPPQIVSSFTQISTLQSNHAFSNEDALNYIPRLHLHSSFYLSQPNDNTDLLHKNIHNNDNSPTSHFEKMPLTQIFSLVKKLANITLYSDPYIFCINKSSGLSMHASDYTHNHKNNENIEMTVDTMLEYLFILSQHYNYFRNLLLYIGNFKADITANFGDDYDEAKHAINMKYRGLLESLPYSTSEIKLLSSLSEEGQEYYNLINMMISSTQSTHHQSDDHFNEEKSSRQTTNIFPLLTADPQRPRLVHRLDKSTTGSLIIAKSRLTAKVLGYMFKDISVNANNKTTDSLVHHEEKMNHIQKVYLALLFTHPFECVKEGMTVGNNGKMTIIDTQSLNYDELFGSSQLGDDHLVEAKYSNTLSGNTLKRVQNKQEYWGTPCGIISSPTSPYLELSTTSQHLPQHKRKGTKKTDNGEYKLSTSYYQRLYQHKLLSLYAFSPVTGHIHQLRIHSAAGWTFSHHASQIDKRHNVKQDDGFQSPIFGDDKYNSVSIYKNDKLEQYYTQLQDHLASKLRCNDKELHLLSLSISLPHPLIFSHHFSLAGGKSNQIGLIPQDDQEYKNVMNYLRNIRKINEFFPNVSCTDRKISTDLSLPILSIQSPIPGHFKHTLQSIGVTIKQ